ncbi:MAG: polyprenyl synthetase family protein [Acidobacteriota bacterium]|nr:polyprenyl synthetase family protein [Acidobacteriota bacterium]
MSRARIQLETWLDVQRRAVDEALEAVVPADREPALVWEAMRYSLFAGGKRLRPVLALAAAEAVAERRGSTAAQAHALTMPCACALELIHTYSLVHDDLPAMDDDVLRRGRPTAHVVYGEGLAILVGDALLTEAFAHLAIEPRTVDGVDDAELAWRKIAAIRLIADAAGPSGMVGGQAIDLRAAGGDAAPLDADGLRDMHGRKTGALIRAAALAGASMAGADTVLCSAIDDYASDVGLAFQIVDDILDVEGASADLGKTAGKDAAAGKPTYPAIYGLDASRRLAAECIDRSLAALDSAGLAGQLPALAGWVVGRHS